MNLVPNEKRLVVEKIEASADPKSKGGLFLPEGSTPTKTKSRQGKVVATPGSEANCCAVPKFEVNDIVVFDKNAGTEITVDGQDYLILHFDDVLVKIK
jgi:chaperonin GroES